MVADVFHPTSSSGRCNHRWNPPRYRVLSTWWLVAGRCLRYVAEVGGFLAQPGQGTSLDLADPFAAQVELVGHLFQRSGPAVEKAKP